MALNNNNQLPQTPERHWPLHLHLKGSWLAIGLVAIALILVSYFGLHSSPTKKKPAVPTYQAQISITDTGFVPTTLSVKTGTQVTWTNNDTSPHQVAADPYPKNDSILGFDSTLVLQTGDSYSFSFIHPGTYTYHDQLNPFKLLGTVVVK